jgi:hypothetical protein
MPVTPQQIEARVEWIAGSSPAMTMKHRHLRFGPTSIGTVGIGVGVGARTEENLCLIVTESAGDDLEAKSLRNERESQR